MAEPAAEVDAVAVDKCDDCRGMGVWKKLAKKETKDGSVEDERSVKENAHMIGTSYSMIRWYSPMRDANDTRWAEDKLRVEREHHRSH